MSSLVHILFATLVLPNAETTGGEIASQAIIDAMRKAGHQVEVFGFVREPMDLPDESIAVEQRPIESAVAGWQKYKWLTQSWAYNRPYVVQKFFSRRLLAALKKASAQRRADLLVIDHAKMGWLLPYAPSFARTVILVAHNHEAALYRDEARNASFLQKWVLARESRLLDQIEQSLASNVDQIWTLSQADRQSFAHMAETRTVELLPLPGRSIQHSSSQHQSQFDVGLLGTWAWNVNGKGLSWFIEQVVPLLPSAIDIRIGGRGSERWQNAATNIRAVGFVEDAVRFIGSARVMAIPSVSGSGVQLKTIEAISAGMATVSTTIGVRGIHPLPSYVAVADTPRAFADAILQQLSAPAGPPSRGQEWATQRQASFDELVQHLLSRLEDPRSRLTNLQVAG